MKGSTRHSFVYIFCKIVLPFFLKRKLRYSCENIKPKSSAYIVLSNHVTNYDPLLVGISFWKPMYFVASDHLFRMGLISKLLVFLVSPISRVKATTETKTVMDIYRRLREGHNICIFAEGNSTFCGETRDVPFSIAKLARRTGAALITYRLRGGYFTLPRWSKTIRKGRMTGEFVREYSHDEMMTMSDQELYDCICSDIYVNAYKDQENGPVSYKGKAPAENLETVLYCCPNCHRFSTLLTSDNKLFCDCGLKVLYTETGYIVPYSPESPLLPFTTITEWFDWQHVMLTKLTESFIIKEDLNTPIFFDDHQVLLQTFRTRFNHIISKGTMSFYLDRFEIGTAEAGKKIFYHNDISDMAIIMQKNLAFSTKSGETYEIRCRFPRNAVKYLHLYKAFAVRYQTIR